MTQLQFYLSSCINNVESMLTDGYLQECENPYDKDFMQMLLAEAKRHFKKLGNDEWNYQKKDVKLFWLLSAFYEEYDDVIFQLVFFIMYSFSLSRVEDNVSEVLSCVAGVLAGREVSPHSYSAYSEMFLSQPIFDDFSSLDYESRFKCALCIVDEVSIQDVIAKRYGLVKRIISSFVDDRSPVFMGNYSLENICKKILECMSEEANEDFFDEADEKMLAYVNMSLVAIQADEHLVEKIRKLEKKYASERVTLMKAVLIEIYKYCALGSKGMKILPKKDPSKK